MATSGRINLIATDVSTTTNAGYLNWNVVSQSAIKNSSTIKFTLYASRVPEWGSSYKISSLAIYGRIDGEQVKLYEKDLSSSSPTISSNSTYNIVTDTLEYPHDLDGTKKNALFFVRYFTDTPENYTAVPSGVDIGITLSTIKRAATILTASNFTDEENPSITYSVLSNASLDTLEVCISSADGVIEVPYRVIPTTETSYTFALTEAERNALRQAAKNNQTINVNFILRLTRGEEVGYYKATRALTIVGSEPIIDSPTVRDVNSDTLALTGDENTVVRYESMAEYNFKPIASKAATIVSQSVQCGNKIVTGLSQGVIDDVESNLFVFSATDSRGLTATKTVEKKFVDYLKPTCYQKITTELVGETGAQVNLTISGNYFNGSFGAVTNTLKLEVRHTQNDGTMGDWVDLSPLGYTYEGNTYELNTTITGLDYSQAYTFQCRATDKLNYVQSAQYVVQIMPLFDWSNEDFNFNVPVNMHGETVLRHNKSSNNTVLSGSGGHIYLRPGGTEDTSNETIFYPDGSVNFSGAIKINGEELKVDNPAADYIVETGSEAMGSNGTWYWEKWNSGKAVCYGCRNYGRMAITTSATNHYRSSMLWQDYPSGLFTDVPDYINATRNSKNASVLCGTVGVSANTTDEVYFEVHAPYSLTLDASYISFHIIGRWK